MKKKERERIGIHLAETLRLYLPFIVSSGIETKYSRDICLFTQVKNDRKQLLCEERERERETKSEESGRRF